MSDSNLNVRTIYRSSGYALNKRVGIPPIPINLKKYLSSEQVNSIRHMEAFGWQLMFVRRTPGTEPVVVVSSKETAAYGVLAVDGSIDTQADISIR